MISSPSEASNDAAERTLTRRVRAPRQVPPPPQLITQRALALLLAVSTDTVKRLRQRGDLDHVKVNGRVMFRADDVAAYIEDHTHHGGTR